MADGINLGLTLCTDDAFLFVTEDGPPASSINVNGAKDGEMLDCIWMTHATLLLLLLPASLPWSSRHPNSRYLTHK